MRAIEDSEARTPAEWHEDVNAGQGAFAGRGIKEKCGENEDAQILEALQGGTLTMQLWGVSLSRTVAESFGQRFLFMIDGPFQGVAAWRESGIEAEQEEIITGGTYEVVDMNPADGSAPCVVLLRQVGPIPPLSA